MNSLINYNKNNESFNKNKSLRNKKNYILTKTLNNTNHIISSYDLKNKSRNNKFNLLLLTESNIKEKNNNLKTFFNTSNTIKIKKNKIYSRIYSNKKPNKTKKDFYKKKIKDLLIDIDNNNENNIFGKRLYIFDEINSNKDKIPKVKTQEQLNYYLINDFKDNDPPQIEIDKSLKNRRMDEEFDKYKIILNEKRYYKNISLINEYKKKENIKLVKIDYSPSLNNNNNNNSPRKYKRKSKKILTFYRPVIFYNDIYNNYYKNKEKDIQTLNESKSSKNKIIEENLSKEIKPSFHIKSPTIRGKRRSVFHQTFSDSITNTSYSFKHNHIHFLKNHNFEAQSEQLYRVQKKQYKKYLKNTLNLRANNFIEQMEKLEIEKNKLKEEKENNNGKEKKLKLTEFNEEKLLLEIRKKNILIDSFGIEGNNIHNKEDDIDEDNFKGIKNYHLNMGMGATYMHNLKSKLEPRYILKNFQKKTLEKYKGNKGIYFGPNNKEIERLKQLYKK